MSWLAEPARTLISGRALAAARSRSAAVSNFFFASTTLAAFTSAPSDSASAYMRSSDTGI